MKYSITRANHRAATRWIAFMAPRRGTASTCRAGARRRSDAAIRWGHAQRQRIGPPFSQWRCDDGRQSSERIRKDEPRLSTPRNQRTSAWTSCTATVDSHASGTIVHIATEPSKGRRHGSGRSGVLPERRSARSRSRARRPTRSTTGMLQDPRAKARTMTPAPSRRSGVRAMRSTWGETITERFRALAAMRWSTGCERWIAALPVQCAPFPKSY